MTYWWVTPWIITFFVFFIIWTAIGLSFAKDWFADHDLAIALWVILFFAWSVPLLVKIILDIIIPAFLAFWFLFKP